MHASMIALVGLLLGVAIGGTLGWLITSLCGRARLARWQAEHAAAGERVEWLQQAQHALRDAFEALAARCLRANADDFSGKIQTHLSAHADQTGLVTAALQSSLHHLDHHLRALESKREGAYGALTENLAQLRAAAGELRTATEQLRQALQTGPVRGRWGEIQLRKVVELAGMSEHVSFTEQTSVGKGRPDLIIYLPNDGHLPVDAKFPLQAYLEAMTTSDAAVRKKKLEEHAKTLKLRIRDLAQKKYWESVGPGPELVILFIPLESCLLSAYECDPDLVEGALAQKVVLASPLTLVGLLKAIAYGWQQFTISENAQRILEQGQELYRRAAMWLEHYRRTGDRMAEAVEAYNASVASLHARFWPAARRFEELAALTEELPAVAPLPQDLHRAARLDAFEERSS
jgi:DNA recombination protein RmuC